MASHTGWDDPETWRAVAQQSDDAEATLSEETQRAVAGSYYMGDRFTLDQARDLLAECRPTSTLIKLDRGFIYGICQRQG